MASAGAERRRHRRYELRHDALLVVQGSNPASCEVANICEEGMWLESVTAPSVLGRLTSDPTIPVEVHLFIDSDHGEQHQRMRARIRRIKGVDIGVQFETPAPQLIALLTEPNVSDRRRLMDASERTRLWRIFRQQLSTLLNPLLDAFIDASLTAINSSLEKAASISERNHMRDARLILIDERDVLIRHFSERWQSLAELFREGSGKSEDRGQLELVDKALFEDWLELQMVASSLSGRHRDTLFRLNQLVSQLAQKEISDRINPLAPIPLCQALQYAVFRCGFDEAVKPLLYQAFERALEENWSTAVEEISQTMHAEGLRVLGLEDMPVHTRSEASRPRSVLVNDDGDTEGAHTSSESNRPSRSGTVLRLFGVRRNPQAPDQHAPGVAASNALGAVHSELLETLASHGQSLETAMANVVEDQPALGKAMGQGHWDQVRLVDRIFDAMDQLEQLPDHLRQLLNQLRLPVLQLVLNDQDFLDDPDHPARGVLNNLMQLCVAARGSSNHLRQTVTEIVGRLTREPVPDDETLYALNEQLRGLVERQKQAFLRNADRIAKTHEGRQQLERARCAIQRRINACLAGREVPMVLLDLLAAGWEQIMVLALLREGADSQAVAELFGVVVQIQRWLGPNDEGEEAAFERELETPALLDLIERQMVTTGEPARHRGVIKRLGAQLREEERPEYVWLASYPMGEDPEERAKAPEVGGSRWYERAQELSLGDWVALEDEKGETRRMRLVWVGDEAYKFVFLTPEGLHELEYDFHEVIESLSRGQMQRVETDQIPFVDQSLYDIVQDLYREMAFRATHDPLTGCLSRHEFEKHLARLCQQASARHDTGVLILVDVDQFSVVNATYGTRGGDAVLREMGTLLAESATNGEGAESRVGRLGSNEFAVAITPLPVEEGLDRAEAVRRRVRDHRFHTQGASFGTTVSVGVADIGGEILDASGLLNAANQAMKSAREAGGDCIRFAGEQQQRRQQNVLQWIPHIDRALNDGTLALRGQRILPLAEEGGEFCEMLLGLRDERGEPVSPQSFMEAAEQSRRVTRVDRWVVDRAFDWMQAQPAAVERLEGVNINLSGASLNDDAFLGYLEERLRDGSVPVHKLCFEVTETAAVANLHYTADFMREMKRLGCRFALDDFGTGMSSYAYLQHLPVDFLKIDGVFIRDLTEDLTHYAMVRSINELAHFLGLATIGEFVEDMETMEALREISMDYVQGFGIARPRFLDEAPRTQGAAGSKR